MRLNRRDTFPGVPSAKEVAEHGVRTGEMEAKLLAKIEELTLYQISLEKRIDALSGPGTPPEKKDIR